MNRIDVDRVDVDRIDVGRITVGRIESVPEGSGAHRFCLCPPPVAPATRRG